MTKVRMIQYISGGRHDGRNWPDPMNSDGIIDVPDWEARDLIIGGNAYPVEERERTAAQQADTASAEAALAAEHAEVASREAAAAAETARAPDGGGAGSEPGEPLADTGTEPTVAAPEDASAAPAPPAPDPAGVAPAMAGTPAAPAPSAPKQAWIDFAVAQGADVNAVSAMTKADLMSRYGGRL